MKKKQWCVESFSTEKLDTKELDISILTAYALASKGYDDTIKAKEFLDSKKSKLIDPFLLKDMQKAVDLIKTTIANGEKIVIYGDYDVDGVTSTSILTHYFKEYGANVDYYIPNRAEEGYGLNKSALDKIAQNGCKLVITVDCGITAVDEVLHAKSLGLNIIITDHHSCKDELPKADALVNPKQPNCQYPYKELAGVGVAFKLLCAFDGDNTKIIEKYSDITAIGTIADVMPLTSENRSIVSRGIECLEKTENIGLRHLLQESLVKEVSSGAISFKLAPRINAAGRMGKASDAVSLLLSTDEIKARNIALELCEQNLDRQKEEQEIAREVMEKIENEVDFTKDRAIVICGENWHHGVVGIVSSRVIEKYYLPVIVISVENGVAKGSARSIKGFNMFQSLSKLEHLLEKFGGHEMAAGMTLSAENVDKLRYELNEIAKETISQDDLIPKLYVAKDVSLNLIDVKSVQSLSSLEPYGPSNAQPIFMSSNVEIVSVTALSEGKHQKIRLTNGSVTIDGLYFAMPTEDFAFKIGDTVDVAYTLNTNEYRGKKSAQLLLRDIRPCLKQRTTEEESIDLYKAFSRDFKLSTFETMDLTPEKSDFATIYRLLLKQPKNFDLLDFTRKVGVTPAKTLVCLDCFKETGLINYQYVENIIDYKLKNSSEKVSLESADTYIKLQTR